jgi:predicted dehydrogenase
MRVGISGYGLAGRTFHAPLIASLGHEIVGVLTNSPERADHVAIDFPSCSVLSTFDQLLDLELDLVVIATANTLHKEQALAAIERGVAIVVDKPFALSLKDTNEILSAADKAGVLVTTFFNRLWDSDTLTAAKAMGDETLGKVFRFESRFERFRPELRPGAWRESSARDGGGLLFDLQPHLLSTALHLFGPGDLVGASVRSISGSGDDDAVLTVKHASGVDSYLSASAIMGSPGPRIRLSGDRGSMIVDDLDPQEELLRKGEKPVHGTWNLDTRSTTVIVQGENVVAYDSLPGNYGEFYREVFAAIETGSPLTVTHQLIRSVATIIDQARELSFR